MNPRKKTLYFTFGNHMHWTDMQWLWGYHVLPGSVRDMLHLIAETGTKACVNFDGIGYEKMAAECPEALAELRAAVQDGRVEVVGASYGQPYGLFHGGESNIRQRIFGIRAVMRTLGVRPRAFWEEEFDGKAEEVRVRFPGPIARSFKTNLMGEVERELRPEPVEAPPGLGSVAWNAVRLAMRPHEIATLYLDLELGRKVPRDLDAHRKVWATVHKTPPA